MNRDNIFRLARKDWIKTLCPEIADWQVDLIVERIDLAVAAEREECAKVCEEIVGPEALDCAAAIRARGESR